MNYNRLKFKKSTVFLSLNFTILFLFSLPSCSVFSRFGSENKTNNKSQEKLAYVIENLEKATFSPVRAIEWQFDYGFDNGGLLNKFEYVRSLFSFQDFQSMLDYPIFLSGPHSDKSLNLNSKFTFGHYNPKFVSDLRENINEILKNENFVKSTKPILEKYNFLDLLERYEQVYNETNVQENEYKRIKKSYIEGLKNKTWEEYSYSYILPEKFKSETYWN